MERGEGLQSGVTRFTGIFYGSMICQDRKKERYSLFRYCISLRDHRGYEITDKMVSLDLDFSICAVK